jgi:hypothetical protein
VQRSAVPCCAVPCSAVQCSAVLCNSHRTACARTTRTMHVPDVRVRGGAQLIDAVLHSLAGDMRGAAKRLAVRSPTALRLRVGTPRDSRFEREPLPWQRAPSSVPVDAFARSRSVGGSIRRRRTCERSMLWASRLPRRSRLPPRRRLPRWSSCPSLPPRSSPPRRRRRPSTRSVLLSALPCDGAVYARTRPPVRTVLNCTGGYRALGSSAGAHARKRSGR